MYIHTYTHMEMETALQTQRGLRWEARAYDYARTARAKREYVMRSRTGPLTDPSHKRQ